MGQSLTGSIVRFLQTVTFETIPPQAADIASRGMADCIAAMVAGRAEPAVSATRRVFANLRSADPAENARLLFSEERAPIFAAACINATAAHALDYDDVSLRGHPSSVLMTVALLEGERLDLSGAQVIAAYVAGYEVWAELVNREPGQLRTKGWHPTGMYGSIAAAAVAIVTRKLSPQIAENALGIAASQASGLAANFGSMTKPFHAGRAAQGGLLAVDLAEAGMTATPGAIEDPQGFLNAFSPDGKADRTSPAGLGKTWQILRYGLSMKRYPICYSAHRSVDAMLDLLKTHPIEADDVESVVVRMSEAQARMLRHHQPDTALAAKFSIEFAMAATILEGRLGLRELTDDCVARKDIQALLARVKVETTDVYDPELPDYSPFDLVTVRLKGGKSLVSEEVRRPFGHATRPLGWDELWGKFDDCLAGDFAAPAREALYGKLRRLSSLQSVRKLYEL